MVALPRGGVPVAYEVAHALGAPLDVCVVRKVGVPWHPELGLGAVAEGGHVYLSRELVSRLGVSQAELSRAVETKLREVADRVQKFRSGRPRISLEGRTVLLVDDGTATGGTVRAAVAAVRADDPKQIVLAAPVAAADVLEELAAVVDRTLVLLEPHELYAIGLWYEDFGQVPDEEVVHLLERARAERANRSGAT